MTELIGMLTSQLGVNENQAKGGAGALFQLAQQQLGGDFSKITEALPGVTEMMASAPQPSTGGLGAIAGAAMSAFGGSEKAAGLMSLASQFKELDLDMDTVMKFAPIVMTFVKSEGGEGIAKMLEKAFSN